MPPKVKFTRDDIIKAAFEITRQEGFNAVVARNVAKKLGSTVSPIFTAFENMEELKKEVYCMAKAKCFNYMRECVNYKPAFKEFGLRWIQFALNEPNLYKLIFLGDGKSNNFMDSIETVFSDIIDILVNDIIHSFNISRNDSLRLINQMIMHANGIAVFCMQNITDFDIKQIGRLLSETCMGLIMLYKTSDGAYDPEFAQHMASAISNLPTQIKK